MFKFLKSLLGFNKEDLKDAGVQLEQAPYKVEPASVPLTANEGKQVPINPTVLAKTVMRKPRKPRTPKAVD
jgi:hypothetical protein